MSAARFAPIAAELRAVLRAGRAAAEARTPSRANPYRPDGDTARERVLARLWLVGHLRGNPVPEMADG